MTDQILTESAVTPDGQPFIVVRMGTASGQLTVDSARELGLHFLECAEAAEQDANLYLFAREQLGLAFEEAGMIVARLRLHRGGQT